MPCCTYSPPGAWRCQWSDCLEEGDYFFDVFHSRDMTPFGRYYFAIRMSRRDQSDETALNGACKGP
jgi:hypothetical protein